LAFNFAVDHEFGFLFKARVFLTFFMFNIDQRLAFKKLFVGLLSWTMKNWTIKN